MPNLGVAADSHKIAVIELKLRTGHREARTRNRLDIKGAVFGTAATQSSGIAAADRCVSADNAQARDRLAGLVLNSGLGVAPEPAPEAVPDLGAGDRSLGWDTAGWDTRWGGGKFCCAIKAAELTAAKPVKTVTNNRTRRIIMSAAG